MVTVCPSLESFSQPIPPDSALSGRKPDLPCVADKIGERHGAELARVSAQVAIIAEQEYLAGRDGKIEVAVRAARLPLHPPTMLSGLLGNHEIAVFDDFRARKTAAVDNDVMRRDGDAVARQADHALDVVLRAIVRKDENSDVAESHSRLAAWTIVPLIGKQPVAAQ